MGVWVVVEEVSQVQSFNHILQCMHHNMQIQQDDIVPCGKKRRCVEKYPKDNFLRIRKSLVIQQPHSQVKTLH